MSPEASRSPADPPGLVALDKLAAHLASSVPELRVGPAATAGEREAALRLRHRQVVTQGWADAATLASDVEADRYDTDAIHLVAWDGAELIGTIRLVPPAADRPLPVEAAFELTIEPNGRVVEIGRLVIDESRRGDPAHRAWGALFAHAWIEVRRLGFTVMAGAASERLVARYHSLGLPFEILGPARSYWGEQRHPVRLDPARAERPTWFDDAQPRPITR
jgi:predicted GNAT family N-acyltransferase